MKCKNCGEKLNKDSVKCPYCLTYNTLSSLGGLNLLLIVLAILQAVFLIVMAVGLVRGHFVERSIADKDYRKAAELMERFGFICGDERAETLSADAVTALESDYIDEKIDYDSAVDAVSRFGDINSGTVGDMADKAAENILEISKSRENLRLGKEALEKGNFGDAVSYYQLIEEADIKYYPLKDELTDGVYKALESYLDDIVERSSYEDAVAEASRMLASSHTEDFSRRLVTIENNYLYKWIKACEDEGNFFGENGAMELTLWYSQKAGDAGDAGDIYMNYVNYLNDLCADGSYREALHKMDEDFPAIEEYSTILDVEKFNSMRIYFAEGLLEESRSAGVYIGTDGAIALAKALNSYGADPKLDVKEIIGEYTERERQEFISWLNYKRGDYGLTAMKDDADLEKAASSMISDDGESVYNNVTFENNMSKYKIEYSLASTLTIMGCTDSENFADSIGNESEYSIITEPGLKKIGVGMKFDEKTENFSWFVIGIK